MQTFSIIFLGSTKKDWQYFIPSSLVFAKEMYLYLKALLLELFVWLNTLISGRIELF